MYLKEISIQHFRNIDYLNLSFDKGIKLIRGNNGHGKTNLLEAIYFLGNLVSFRTHLYKDMMRWGDDFFKLMGTVNVNNDEKQLEIFYSNEKKRLKINGVEKDGYSSYIGNMPVFVFYPGSISLIKGLPVERRKFMDRGIYNLEPDYIDLVNQYNRVLKQRNSLLREPSIDKRNLEVWNEKLIELGLKIIMKRLELIHQLKLIIKDLKKEMDIGKDANVLEISYSNILDEENEIEDLRRKFINMLHRFLNEERRRGVTLIGPHRDDMKISFNGKDLKSFGSQGEQRLVTFILLFSMIIKFKRCNGYFPIILLDDIASELDSVNRKLIIDFIGNDDHQVFITQTDDQYERVIENFRDYKSYTITDGKLYSDGVGG